jgi:ferritin-like metal-binding protein YciE
VQRTDPERGILGSLPHFSAKWVGLSPVLRTERNLIFGGNMSKQSLKKLYVDELKDLFSAESQLVKALPKMAKAASSDELRVGFEKHLEQTKGHVQRLEEIFESLDENPKGKKCVGMEGLIKEGSEVMEEDFEKAVLDAGLIGAARRVEHYEMAAYGAVCEIAKVLGQTKHASLLEKTLAEEKQTDETLTGLAKDINTQANVEGPEEHDTSKPGRKAGRAA